MSGENNPFYSSNYKRQVDDFYSTDPTAIDYLLKHETFSKNIWECACGNGVLSERLKEYDYNVMSSDLIDRGYGITGLDFLKCKDTFKGDIITNPPYKQANDFVLKALKLTNKKVAMFLKIQFLEGQQRFKDIFKKHPPSKVLPFVKRINCYRNDDRSLKGSTVLYAWFVWNKEHSSDTIIEWIDNR